MAGNTASIYETVARLAEKLGCPMLSYGPDYRPEPPTRGSPIRYLFPTGPYAISLWTPGDEVHLVCVTNNSSDVFWEYIAEKLEREDLPKSDCVVSRPQDQHVVWLHYCLLPPSFGDGLPHYPRFNTVPHSVQQNLSRLRDVWTLRATIDDGVEEFCHDYQALRSWADAAGIFAPHFGFLDADILLWMLLDVAFAGQSNKHFSRGVRSFLDRYSDTDSISDALSRHRDKGYAPPPDNAADGHAIIAREIRKVVEQPSLFAISQEQYYESFCEQYSVMIMITPECWVYKQREAFHSNLVSEITHLNGRMLNTIPSSLDLRIWPHAFKPSEGACIYVVGLEPQATQERRPHYDPHSKFTKVIEEQVLALDTTIGTATIRICPAEEAKKLPNEYSTTSSQPENDSNITTPSLQPSQSRSNGKKFPPASQVLSRLRWDPAHADHDYEVGYEDRFEGMKWLPLEQWGKATEEEDFVPEHRIRLFRRMEKGGPGAVVWDRVERICY